MGNFRFFQAKRGNKSKRKFLECKNIILGRQNLKKKKKRANNIISGEQISKKKKKNHILRNIWETSAPHPNPCFALDGI
jgi:hypothetical protein